MFAAPIERLIRELRRLPGVGEKTATRYALHILRAPDAEVQTLANTLLTVKERIRPCSVCHQLTDTDPCAICASPRRDSRVLCLVEDQASLLAVEKAQAFFGRYHLLGGHLSPMDGVGPDDLNLRDLLQRVRTEGVEEVILATNTGVEGEATALYVKRLLEPLGVRISRIARGVPVGGELEYADAITLGRALESRERF